MSGPWTVCSAPNPDCEGAPISAVDACDGAPVGPAVMTPRDMSPADLAEIKRLLSIPGSQRWHQPIYPMPDPVRVRVDDGFGNIDAEKVREAGRVAITGVPSIKGVTPIGEDEIRWTLPELSRRLRMLGPDRFLEWVEPSSLLTRTLEAEADALAFPPAGSEWRNEAGRSGVVEYRPNGRGWRLLYSDGGQSEWCHEGIREGWERVPFEPAPVGDGFARSDAHHDEAAPAAPQAVTLEVAAINASEPGEYRSPADAHLPNFGVSDG